MATLKIKDANGNWILAEDENSKMYADFKVGDIEPVIDGILAIQDELTGGNTEAAYNEGFEAGKQDMNATLMNAITANSKKTEYRYAFYGANWNDELFKPQIVIKPTNFQSGFQGNNVEYGAYTDLLDFSTCQSLSSAFMNSKVKKLKVIDARKTTSNFNGLANAFYGCTQLESIDEFYPSDAESKAAFSNTFYNCSALTRIIFKSEMLRSGLNLQYSPNLSRESIESIINNLSNTASGLSITLSKTAVNNAFTNEEWAALIAAKSNWTISLA